MSEELRNLLKHTHFVFYGKDKTEEQIKEYNDNLSLIEKKLKALEIIKNSGYISIDIMLSQNYITRKEYDLLKEVLK